MTETLPCPNPDCTFPYVEGHLGVVDPTEDFFDRAIWQVVCPCGITGPRAEAATEAEAMELAILAWNALPRPLALSADPPMVGTYWFRQAGYPDDSWAIFHVLMGVHKDELPKGDWYGPLPEPPLGPEEGEL